MKQIFSLLGFLFLALGLQGQITLLPLGSNPMVEQQGYLLQKAKADQRQQLGFRAKSQNTSRSNCAFPNPDDRYAVSGGDTIFIFVDTAANGGGTLTLLPCHQFGSVSPVAGSSSQFYVANAGINVAADTVCVRYCSPLDTLCDTLRFAIKIVKAGQFSTLANQILPTQTALLQSIDTSTLFGAFDCESFEQLHPELGEVSLSADFGLLYEARRFAGLDTVIYIYCDEFTICDTLVFPFQIKGDTLSLPFLDEFSYSGPYPDPKLWLEDDGFVNNTFAIAPKGLGVLTLDGLQANGRPWGQGKGITDVLTSAYLDLSSLGDNSAYISYHFQAGGYCDPVEFGDSMVLQFKQQDGFWVTQDTMNGANPTPGYLPLWKNRSLTISDGAYKYNGFQFRFVAYGDKTGINDPWHLDYIRVGTTQIASANFGDIAFTQPPPTILRRYSSMPWSQFDGFETLELRDSLNVGLFNHFGIETPITDSRAGLEELTLGNTLFNPPFVLVTGNAVPGVPINSVSPIVDFANYKTAMETLFDPEDENLDFQLTYTLVNNSQENQVAYLRNDTVQQHTRFENYMSYDDGTAERAVIASASGSQLAMRYNLNTEDSLRAIRIMFPRINTSVAEQNFRLRVWIDTLDDSPEYDRLVLPYYADNYFDTLQGFTTYVLDTALLVPAGNLYVGWQQLANSSNSIPVGFDVNYPSANNYTYFYSGDTYTWSSLAGYNSFKGAIMMHPVFGDVAPPCTPCGVATKDKKMSAPNVVLYPNPSSGQLFLQSADLKAYTTAQIVTVSGQSIWSGDVSEQLAAPQLPAGLYFLQLSGAAVLPQTLPFVVQR